MNFPKNRRLVYLGWQSHSNFGDELIHETWRAALDDDLDILAPLTLGRYLVKQLRTFARHRTALRGKERIVLLGGGTTIGFGTWARHSRLALGMYSASALAIPGAGAAEKTDRFALASQPHDWAAWRSMPRTALMGVRGPLTQQECSKEWSDASVIGDPALLYPLRVNLHYTRKNVLGLCLGSEGRSRFDIPAVAAGAKEAARRLGAEIKLFQMTDADEPVTDQLLQILGDVPVVRFGNGIDVQTMMEEIGSCTTFISERLHGTIAAVSLGVSTTPLSYASKCDDFWLSVTGRRSPLGLRATVDQVTEAVMNSTNEPEMRAIASKVAYYQDELATAASTLNAWIAGQIDTPELLAPPLSSRGALA